LPSLCFFRFRAFPIFVARSLAPLLPNARHVPLSRTSRFQIPANSIPSLQLLDSIISLAAFSHPAPPFSCVMKVESVSILGGHDERSQSESSSPSIRRRHSARCQVQVHPPCDPSSSVAWKSGGYWLLMRSEAHQARKCFPGAVAEIIILASNNLVSGFPNERDYLCSFR
jgi:hypothetical protein